MGEAATVRLDRILANLGYGSRAEVRRLILSGVVRVDDAVERDPGFHATAKAVSLFREALDHPAGVLAAVHKPVGYACSHDER